MSSQHHIVGKRIRCLFCTDPFSPIESGQEGVIRHVDDIGTIHVDWDNGRTLGLIPGKDSFEIV